MVLDPERGCVRGREERKIGPKTDLSFFLIEKRKDKWRLAIDTTKHAPLQSDLDKIKEYAKLARGERIVEFSRIEHPVFPGFIPYGLPEDEEKEYLPPINLAYRCGYCKVIYAGRPDIHESSTTPGFIDFNCGICKGTMYSEEVEPNRCRGL